MHYYPGHCKCITEPPRTHTHTQTQLEWWVNAHTLFKWLINKQGHISLFIWLYPDWNNNDSALSQPLFRPKKIIRLIPRNNHEVKVNCFTIGDISARLTFQMSRWPTFYGRHSCSKNMRKWIDLHVGGDPKVKPGVKKICVFVRLWATVIMIPRRDGINHKVFRIAPDLDYDKGGSRQMTLCLSIFNRVTDSDMFVLAVLAWER